jgi:hypothetical protein
MDAAVAQKLTASSNDFLRVVWPTLSRRFGGGEIYPVESVTEKGFAKQLDVLAGIDVWHVVRNEGMRGIASRVQWTDSPFDTFSVRYALASGQPTEFQKRLHALRNQARGFLLPEFTVQAYVAPPKGEGALLSAAVMKTSSLIYLFNNIMEDMVDAQKEVDWGFRQPWGGDETFVWLRWDYIQGRGYPISIYRNAENQSIGRWIDGKQPLVSHVHRLS